MKSAGSRRDNPRHRFGRCQYGSGECNRWAVANVLISRSDYESDRYCPLCSEHRPLLEVKG